MKELTLDQARAWIAATAAAIDRNADRLGELDAAIGDGDHGANMTRGFASVIKKLNGTDVSDLGGLFKLVGMTLLSTVGGAAGPLYGGFFLELGKRCLDREQLDAAQLTAVIDNGLADIRRRGKAELGDKTMVDALAPAVAAMRDAAGEMPAVTGAAAKAARQGALDTAPLVARKGRASYLGERSAGHEDPGANSMALLIEALAGVCGGQ
jgi:dihydroxyacetone kinase-like protein